MASDQPFDLEDLDDWIESVLSVDLLMLSYVRGGFCSEHPPQGSLFPCVRWWIQSPGKDMARQDGQSGRILTDPSVVIGMLDKQENMNAPDFVDGTMSADPGQKLLSIANKRIYTLMHGRQELFNNTRFTCRRRMPWRISEALTQGSYSVFNGGLYDISAQ